MLRPVSLCLLAAAAATALAGCYAMRPSSGGGQIESTVSRTVNPADIAVPEGYRVSVVATGLTFPTGIAFDSSNVPHVVEAGYSYGEVWTTPRLLRVENGKTEVIATGTDNGPWTGVEYVDGSFYIAEGGEKNGGRILRISNDGAVDVLVDNLPSTGDHHTNGPAVGSEGALYFGIGTATNSGVVGELARR